MLSVIKVPTIFSVDQNLIVLGNKMKVRAIAPNSVSKECEVDVVLSDTTTG